MADQGIISKKELTDINAKLIVTKAEINQNEIDIKQKKIKELEMKSKMR